MHTDEEIARIYKALCDPTRVAIVKFLKNEERCACQLTKSLDIAQSKLSYHMKILCESGIIESWNVGKWTHYQVSKEGGAKAIQILKELTQE